MPGRAFVALRVLVLALAAVGASMLAVGVVSAVAPAAASAAVWRVQPGTSPLMPSGQFDAVSCASSTACTAVGSYASSSGAQVALAEQWNGTSWSIQATPTTRTGSALVGVSCTSSTACTAVGSYTNSSGTAETLAERWNGTTWSVQATPNPAGASSSYLAGVSCASTTACTAVGDYTSSSGADVTLAERWNGTSWSIQATPNPEGTYESSLGGVSCTSSTACTAVGYYANSSGTYVTLAERWNGTSWSIQATPNPTGADGFLAGVSCTSGTVCTAVGDYGNSSGAVGTLAERWNGTSWSIQASPNPTGTSSQISLGGVSCASSAACTAVGSYTSSSGAVTTRLAERWNGTSWSIQATPTPMGTSRSSLYGVSCTSSTACTAVGGFSNISGALTLADRWTGTSWSMQTSPTPIGPAGGGLNGVSCASSAACTAVGFYVNSSGAGGTLAERWNGTSWSIQATPTDTGGSFGGVSCTSSAACTAVGFYDNSSGREVALAERWNGTGWSIQATPTPTGDSSSSLDGVSCTSTTACTAVGSITNRSGAEVALAERWNGTSWSIQATPTPTGASQISLNGVSCTSSTACTAVGSYNDGTAGYNVALAERWNGTSWSIQATPTPTGSSEIVLGGVSCTSSTACTAVGSYNNTSALGVTLAERWNGTSWSIQATPSPTGAFASYLGGVSCTSSTACTAVGDYFNSSGTDLTLAEGWNGTSWSIQATPTLTGNYKSSLGGVSCTSSAACMAVGSQETISGPPLQLAERYS